MALHIPSNNGHNMHNKDKITKDIHCFDTSFTVLNFQTNSRLYQRFAHLYKTEFKGPFIKICMEVVILQHNDL